MIETIEIEECVKLMQSAPLVVLDIRSPKEYAQGHIPGALSLPLLNDEERHVVGITYKELGKEEAVKRGFELVGHKFSQYIKRAEVLSPDKKVLVYCWRGGMRSNIMAWLLQLAGFEVKLLNKGYKNFRNFCVQHFIEKKNLIMLSGKTGTGKTDVLKMLEAHNEFVLDLERLAHHKGSAFGGLGQEEQPTQEQFENLLAWKLSSDPTAIMWVESESRFIGKLRIPDEFFNQMNLAPIVELSRSMESRAARIIDEYGSFPKEFLEEKTKSLSRRMGGDQVKISLDFLSEDNYTEWVMPLLKYYDSTYVHSMSLREGKKFGEMDLDQLADENVVSALMELKKIYSQK